MNAADEPKIAVRIERTLHAPPDRVFQAFLDPDLMRQWVTPDDLDLDRIRIEPRVGGRIEVWHSRHGASTGRFEGRFVKIDPPRELVYHWAFVGTEEGEYFDTLVTVRLQPLGEGETRITVVHERLAELSRGAPQIHRRLLPGWENGLAQLERAAREAPADRR